jgi:very-short-patch-repair endonuclease
MTPLPRSGRGRAARAARVRVHQGHTNPSFTTFRHTRAVPNERARESRRHPTTAEALLWRLLRNRRFAGNKFRRQHPIGPFVADFACVELRLVIEADGGQHAESAYDDWRTACLEAEGWRVIRFWNNDVLHNTSGVIEMLSAEIALCRGRHPHPPRARVAPSPA